MNRRTTDLGENVHRSDVCIYTWERDSLLERKSDR